MPELDDVVYALATSPSFSSTGVCFAARASGLYRSDDGGASWRFAYASLGLQALSAQSPADAPALPTTAVAVSPSYGVGDETVLAGVNGAVLHSSDGGQHWSLCELTAPAPVVSCLALSRNFQYDHCAFA